jgi:tellurite resistance protein
MSEERGIKETKEVIEGVVELSVVITEALRDGFQAGSDLPAILTALTVNPKMQAAYDNVKEVGAEIKDISVEEGVELGVIALMAVPKILAALKK